MAACMTMAGHDNAVNGAWGPKDVIDEADATRITRSSEDRARLARDAWLSREDDEAISAEAMESYRMMEG
jgi:hypothetical protein